MSQKIGLDDFLISVGGDINKLLALPRDYFSDEIALWDINEAFGFLHDPPGTVYRFNDGMVMSQKEFNAVIANWPFNRQAAKQLGTTTAPGAWWKWRFRNEMKGLDYAPGQPPMLPDGKLNLWGGFGALPEEGDVTLWFKLLEHLFRGAPDEDRDWFERWLAKQVQQPGVKLYTSVVMVGNQGVGKSLAGECFGHVLGDSNWVEIGEEQLNSSFNPYMKGIQFVLANEVVSSDRRADANRLKNMITRCWVEVNEKYLRQRRMRDVVNYYFTSNDKNAVYITNDDRRFFIHHVRHEDKLDVKLKDKISEWINTKAGMAALHYQLKCNVDCRKFNPHDKARDTLGKAITVAHNQTDIDRYAQSIMDNPRCICNVKFDSDLVPLETLVDTYEAAHKNRRISGTALANALGRLGAYCDTQVIKVRVPRGAEVNGVQNFDSKKNLEERSVRVWAISNVAHWKDPTLKHFDKASHIRERLFRVVRPPPKPRKGDNRVADINEQRPKRTTDPTVADTVWPEREERLTTR